MKRELDVIRRRIDKAERRIARGKNARHELDVQERLLRRETDILVKMALEARRAL